MTDREQFDEELGSDRELLAALEPAVDSAALATAAERVISSGDPLVP